MTNNNLTATEREADQQAAQARAELVAAAGAARQEPREQAWLVLLMPDSGAHKTREWRGISASEDDAIERAMHENPGWSVHTFGPDVNAKPHDVQGGIIDSPRWPDGCPLTLNELPVGGPENYKGHIDCRYAAAAVQVDEAKLAAFLATETHAPSDTHDNFGGACTECPWPVHELPPAELAAAVAEWLRGGGQ